MKKIVVTVYAVLVLLSAYSQDNKGAEREVQKEEKIIQLDELIVYPKGDIELLKSPDRKNIRVAIKGKSKIVSQINLVTHKDILIRGIEFYFNYRWGDSEKDGFIVKPIILDSEDHQPSAILFEGPGYFITKKIDQKMYLDLTEYEIEIENNFPFYIGLEFVEAIGNSVFEDFNITMSIVPKQTDISYVKGNCPTCNFASFNLDPSTGLSLKHRLFYSYKQ